MSSWRRSWRTRRSRRTSWRKILNGKLNKFAQERALLTQVHVVDGKKPVQKVLKKATVDAFAVFSVGENADNRTSGEEHVNFRCKH